MVSKERTYSVLIVSAVEKLNNFITERLPEARYFPVTVVSSIGAARRELLERFYDIIIINAPLPDDFGLRLAIDVCNDSTSGALLFVKNELFDDVYDKATYYGVLVLPKPISLRDVNQSLRLICATRERLRRLEKKTVSIEDKIEEIRLVNRAKWLLIDCVKMTESDAHRFIEKQSMDRRISRKEVAAKIIETYG